MPLDGRVLVAVIAALFLALGAGILVGSLLLPGDEAVFRRQEALAARLEADLAALVRRVQGLEQQLERARLQAQAEGVLARAQLEDLVAGRLVGRRVAVLQVGEGTDARLVVDPLAAAGAEVSLRVRVDPAWLRGDRAAAAACAELLGPSTPEAAAPAEAARALARALAGGQEGAGFLAGLEGRGLLHLSGTPSLPVDAVALLLGRCEPDAAASFLRPFLRQAGLWGLGAVGAEASWTSPSLLPACLAEGIPTVSHVDLASGQLCLVAALEEGRGRYGLVAPSRPLPAWAPVPAGG